MHNVANLSHNEREELFIATARRMKLPEAMVEKDFWICWTLLLIISYVPIIIKCPPFVINLPCTIRYTPAAHSTLTTC